MRIEPFCCDMHIRTYADANKRDGTHSRAKTLPARVRECARGHCVVISLTDHNVIDAQAYRDVLNLANDDVRPIVGVEVHVRSNGPKPHHAHMYFNFPPNNFDEKAKVNDILDRLYRNKLLKKDEGAIEGERKIPTLPEPLNEFRNYDFLFLPHGGQSHGTFDNAVSQSDDEKRDDLMLRSVYYNTFVGLRQLPFIKHPGRHQAPARQGRACEAAGCDL